MQAARRTGLTLLAQLPITGPRRLPAGDTRKQQKIDLDGARSTEAMVGHVLDVEVNGGIVLGTTCHPPYNRTDTRTAMHDGPEGACPGSQRASAAATQRCPSTYRRCSRARPADDGHRRSTTYAADPTAPATATPGLRSHRTLRARA